MSDYLTNDNENSERRSEEPDAYGQAALLLVESLLHGLIARMVITVSDATEIVGIAAEVKEEIADQLGDSAKTRQRSLIMLEAIRASLSKDIVDE